MISIEPKVSIIIPSHNKGAYLQEAVNSALSQTWENTEVIVIDDDSTDNSREILSAVNNEKLKLYFVEFRNAAAARNYGLAEATGDFIQFLDADDVISKVKLETQLSDLRFKTDAVGVCSTKSFFHDLDNGEELDSDYLSGASDPGDFLIKLYKSPDNGMVQPNAWLTPRSVIDKAGLWDETLTVDDDGEYFCRVVLHAAEIIYTNRVLNFYRKFRDSSLRLSGQKTHAAFKSMLDAALLKKNHLKSHPAGKNKDAGTAINSLFSSIMVSAYPAHKDVSAAAGSHIDAKSQIIIPKLGGRIVEACKKLFGWRMAVRIKIAINKIRGDQSRLHDAASPTKINRS